MELDAAVIGAWDPATRAAAEVLLGRVGDDQCSEVICNGPAEILVKINGQRYHEAAATFKDAATYHDVLNHIVLPYCDTAARIDGTTMLVEGQLELPSGEHNSPPTLARVHVLAPPLTPFAKVTIAKKARYDFTLDAFARSGTLNQPMAEFLKIAAHARLSFLVSGVTGAGKTATISAMSHYFDVNDRVLVIEDTPELRLPTADVVYLTSSVAAPGQADTDDVTPEWLVRQAMRMRMTRVIIGEVRSGEAFEFLIAASAGAEGSATTIHSDTPRRALTRFTTLASRGAPNVAELTLRREIAETINIVIQVALIDGRNVITAIEEVSSTVRDNGVIATQRLFEFDRIHGVHRCLAGPSDELQALLKQRGIEHIPADWFPTH